MLQISAYKETNAILISEQYFSCRKSQRELPASLHTVSFVHEPLFYEGLPLISARLKSTTHCNLVSIKEMLRLEEQMNKLHSLSPELLFFKARESKAQLNKGTTLLVLRKPCIWILWIWIQSKSMGLKNQKHGTDN